MRTLYESLLDDFDTLVDKVNYLGGWIDPSHSSKEQNDTLRSIKPAIIDGQKSLKLEDLLKAKPDQLFICYPFNKILSSN